MQWLRDEMGLLASAAESAAAARRVPDTGGVVCVPAFAGLGAPYWDPHARGMLIGLTRSTTRDHVVRAVLEGIAHQVADVLAAMVADAATGIPEVRVDGGAAANDFLMQFQADLLGLPVVRPVALETTALGAAFLAGLGIGWYTSTDEIARTWQLERRFQPAAATGSTSRARAQWQRARPAQPRVGRGGVVPSMPHALTGLSRTDSARCGAGLGPSPGPFSTAER